MQTVLDGVDIMLEMDNPVVEDDRPELQRRLIDVRVRSMLAGSEKELCQSVLQDIRRLVNDVLEESSPGCKFVEHAISPRVFDQPLEKRTAYTCPVTRLQELYEANPAAVIPLNGFSEKVADLYFGELV